MVGDTRVGLVESALLISIWVAIGIRMLPPAYKLYIYICMHTHAYRHTYTPPDETCTVYYFKCKSFKRCETPNAQGPVNAVHVF